MQFRHEISFCPESRAPFPRLESRFRSVLSLSFSLSTWNISFVVHANYHGERPTVRYESLLKQRKTETFETRKREREEREKRSKEEKKRRERLGVIGCFLTRETSPSRPICAVFFLSDAKIAPLTRRVCARGLCCDCSGVQRPFD